MKLAAFKGPTRCLRVSPLVWANGFYDFIEGQQYSIQEGAFLMANRGFLHKKKADLPIPIWAKSAFRLRI